MIVLPGSRTLRLVALAFSLVLAPLAPSAWAEAKAPSHYVSQTAQDILTLLPPPPAPGSIAAAADLLAVRQAQAVRTEADVAWAKRVEKGDPFNFSAVLGPWFSREALPLTAALIGRLSDDTENVIAPAKKYFGRPRPFLVDSTIKPCVHAPESGSYPSGHTTHYFVEAMILGELVPAKRDALLIYAERLAWGRVMGGVHFPSDLAAGRVLAGLIVERMHQSPGLARDLEACRAEIDKAAAQ
jgi:acid phosphatase (class A)